MAKEYGFNVYQRLVKEVVGEKLDGRSMELIMGDTHQGDAKFANIILIEVLKELRALNKALNPVVVAKPIPIDVEVMRKVKVESESVGVHAEKKIGTVDKVLESKPHAGNIHDLGAMMSSLKKEKSVAEV